MNIKQPAAASPNAEPGILNPGSGARLSGSAPRPAPAALAARLRSAFSMVELLVTMSLLTLIVFALMAVFSSTQTAFRASVTQTDVLEGGRAAVDLIATDLRTMTPSYGTSNWFVSSGSLNFFTFDNNYSGMNSLKYQPLLQSLPGSPTTATRANVLNYFFILGRNNQNWTAVGYAVNPLSTVPLYPLYRYYAQTNVAVPPYLLFADFTNAIYNAQWVHLSHVMDGVVHLVVRPYDLAGYWMTNNALIVTYGANSQTNFHDNMWFSPPASLPPWAQPGCYCFSNAVPAAVELEMGVLEDRVLQRAESLPAQSVAQSNYLAQQAGRVHVFRQRVAIPNVDPTAYQ